MRHAIQYQTTTKQTFLRSVVFVTPFYMWLVIFTAQPHKEERFMYPAYPFLALNAAIALHAMLAFIGSPSGIIGMIPSQLKLAFVSLFVLLGINAGAFRSIGTVTAYGAPLHIYEALKSPDVGAKGDFVCFGKEWYRFPSSYHLPKGMHAKFIKSEFNGLLPGEFNEAQTGFGFFAGTWLVPPGMNDRNLEDPGKYVSFPHTKSTVLFNILQIDVGYCSFLVDSAFPSVGASALEPPYMRNNERWRKVSCSRFLDPGATGVLGRILWVPDALDALLPRGLQRKWGEYCLLEQKKSSV